MRFLLAKVGCARRGSPALPERAATEERSHGTRGNLYARVSHTTVRALFSRVPGRNRARICLLLRRFRWSARTSAPSASGPRRRHATADIDVALFNIGRLLLHASQMTTVERQTVFIDRWRRRWLMRSDFRANRERVSTARERRSQVSWWKRESSSAYCSHRVLKFIRVRI